MYRYFLHLTTLLVLLDLHFRHQHVTATSKTLIPNVESFSKALSSSSMMSLDKTLSKKFEKGFIPKAATKAVKSQGKLSTRTTSSNKPPGISRPVLNLRRKRGQSKNYNMVKVRVARIKELECKSSFFMSPLHNPVTFSLNSSVYERKEKKCQWNIIGTEQCIPMLSCSTSQLIQPCNKEYLEIVDGVGGAIKICGGNKSEVTNLQATKDLRDLYVHFRVFKTKGSGPTKPLPGDPKELFTCKVTCGKRREGTPLETTFQTKINPKCFCGTKPNEDRIVNGQDAKKFEYPWLVALVETNTRQPFCGGSIINNRFVQTAGHCIKGKFTDYRKIQVMVNGHFFDQSPNTNVPTSDKFATKTYPVDVLEKLDKQNGSRRYNLEEIIVHPLYVSETNDFDIALLKLTEDIDLNPKKLELNMESVLQQPRAICMPPLGSYLRTYSGKKAIIAGWGLPGALADGTMQKLQKLEVHVFSPKECKGMFAHRVNRRMICAGYREGKRDSCAGDSGGPLVLESRPKVWTQIGSVSFGEGCAEPEHPGVYFRTTEGVQWITYNSNYNAGRLEDKGNTNRSATWCLTPP